MSTKKYFFKEKYHAHTGMQSLVFITHCFDCVRFHDLRSSEVSNRHV